MGLCFCGLGGRTCSTNRPPTKKEADPDCGIEVLKFLNPRNLWSKEIKQGQANYNFSTYNKVLTLEDLILSSPACNEGDIHRGDRFHKVKQRSNRRFPPSFDAEIKRERVLRESKESFLMKTEEGGNREFNSSTFHRSRSAKLKKVFRSPEVADTFILQHSYEVFIAE